MKKFTVVLQLQTPVENQFEKLCVTSLEKLGCDIAVLFPAKSRASLFTPVKKLVDCKYFDTVTGNVDLTNQSTLFPQSLQKYLKNYEYAIVLQSDCLVTNPDVLPILEEMDKCMWDYLSYWSYPNKWRSYAINSKAITLSEMGACIKKVSSYITPKSTKQVGHRLAFCDFASEGNTDTENIRRQGKLPIIFKGLRNQDDSSLLLNLACSTDFNRDFYPVLSVTIPDDEMYVFELLAELSKDPITVEGINVIKTGKYFSIVQNGKHEDNISGYTLLKKLVKVIKDHYTNHE